MKLDCPQLNNILCSRTVNQGRYKELYQMFKILMFYGKFFAHCTLNDVQW